MTVDSRQPRLRRALALTTPHGRRNGDVRAYCKARHGRALNGTRLTDQRRFSTWLGGKSIDQGAEFGQDLIEGAGEGPVDGATRGIFMAPAAQLLGNGGDVDLSFAAQAHADALLGQFAQEDGGLDVGN